MYTARPLLAFVVALAATSPARAQCPDGTPPPCRAAAALPAPRGPVDENVIAIFPFRVTGSSNDAASLREGAMDLLALALDEQAGLRVVNSRTLLARARGFSDATTVTEAAAVARSVGAGTMILGTAVVAGTQVRARAEMHDLARGRPMVSVEARGAAADPAPVIDSLAFALARVRLASGAGTTRRSLQEFSTTSPQALRAYLAGERFARQGRWQEASDSLQHSIALDSTFALAYYRLRVVNTFGADVGGRSAEQLIATALRFADRLPRRQRDLLNTVNAMYGGVGSEALHLGDALGQRYPDDVEAAYEQGETYYHFGLALGEPPARALAPFDRALQLDSTFIDPYNHAVELRVMLGDTAGAWALSRRAIERFPRSGVHLALSLAMRAIANGEQPAALAAAYYQRRPPIDDNTNVVTRAGAETWRSLTEDPGRAMRLADAFFVAAAAPNVPRSERVAPLLSRVITLTSLGRYRAAWDVVESLQRLDSSVIVSREAAMLALMSGTQQVERCAALVRHAGPNADATSLGLVGWCAIERRDSALLDGTARRLMADSSAYRAAIAAGLRGLDALRRNDSSAAFAHLLRAYGVQQYGTFFSRDLPPLFALELARLERRRGDLDAATSRLSFGAFATTGVPQRADMEELRAQIAEQKSDTATAIRGWRNFIGLWQDADPELQPRVAAARAALARLKHP